MTTTNDHQAAELSRVAALLIAAGLGPLELALMPTQGADDDAIIEIKMAPNPHMGDKLQRWINALDIDHADAGTFDDADRRLQLVLRGFTEAGVQLRIVALYDRATQRDEVALILAEIKRKEIATLVDRLAELDTTPTP